MGESLEEDLVAIDRAMDVINDRIHSLEEQVKRLNSAVDRLNAVSIKLMKEAERWQKMTRRT